MKIQSPILIVFLILITTALTACAGAADSNPQAVVNAGLAVPENLMQEDAQGAVSVTVTPLNLDQTGEELQFAVAMNTHSVELEMDLTTLAVLTTDTGLTVTPIQWDAPSGGHHVNGTLIFPAVSNGQPLLEGVSTITLTIHDLDAAERIFTWDLPT